MNTLLNKRIACVFKYQLSFGQFRPKEAFKLFDSMVRPILCYAAELWGYQYNKKVESVHLNFCKRYCSLPQHTANVLVYGECGRLPLCIFYMTQCIKYWLKLLRMDPNCYAHQSYKMLKSLDDAGQKSWASNIKHLLFSLGFGYLWIAQEVGNQAFFIKSFK